MNKDVRNLGLWTLLSFVVVFVIIATVAVTMQTQINELESELDHKDEVIQNLRNDLNDLDWYYENRLHFKDLEDDVRDMAIEDLYDRLLEDSNIVFDEVSENLIIIYFYDNLRINKMTFIGLVDYENDVVNVEIYHNNLLVFEDEDNFTGDNMEELIYRLNLEIEDENIDYYKLYEDHVGDIE